jgi:nondiscriminating aspartyl-tRNA synthetase
MVEKSSDYDRFTYTFDDTDTLKANYGIKPYIVSDSDPEERYNCTWTSLSKIDESLVGKEILTRVRVQRLRIKGKGGFVVLRDGLNTAQGCLFVEEGKVSLQMIQFTSSLSHESIVDIVSEVTKAQKPIESCTVKDFELQIRKIFLVQACVKVLPFQIEDANRKSDKSAEEEVEEQVLTKEPENKENKENKEQSKEDKKKEKKAAKEQEKKEKAEKADKEKEKANIIVKSNTRFDNRVLDLRVLATQSLMKLQSAVGRLYRDYLFDLDFVEIHTPKLIQGASEGGTNVFKLKYFDREACLAQSPQLYKQMAIVGGLEKVFEVAPVFRAENSNTGRHLCEFTMLDMEMSFKNHYFEVIDVIHGLFYHIFEGLRNNYKHELNVVANQYPFEILEYTKEVVKLTFHEGVELLKEKGIEQDVNKDLDTITERKLGEIIKEKYKTDFYFLYRYPKSARPFYTMRYSKDENFTNSYDAFIRGEEVLSGAQRIHDYEQLYKNVVDAGINPETLKDYLNAFKLGAPPHGGCGIGLERIVKLFTGFGNVKRCCMFPRDPGRLAP